MENQPAHPPQQQGKTNGLAIASLVISIIGCGVLSIVAIILGHISRSQIKKDPAQQGAGLALAGLIIGYIGIAVVIVGIVVGTIFNLSRPAVSQMREQAYATVSQSNARMVALALINYENATGSPAESLEDLVPDYLSEPVYYTDPETLEELPFEYFTDRASIPFLLGSPRSYQGKRIVVYQDGSVEQILEIEYLDRIGRAP